ncbi:hypothetical protein DFP72DRAFT_849521 [Ephemerocybe angulata]|uniref:Uncharacterized protein n=1 Tax=Ephemerocybe angulata TaxID=980116 RepID=A0A8H6HUQ3_9AGAR|nr:hypothetical protein DFP72DRAFT_849521 [Tulosesus angulatus]
MTSFRGRTWLVGASTRAAADAIESAGEIPGSCTAMQFHQWAPLMHLRRSTHVLEEKGRVIIGVENNDREMDLKALDAWKLLVDREVEDSLHRLSIILTRDDDDDFAEYFLSDEDEDLQEDEGAGDYGMEEPNYMGIDDGDGDGMASASLVSRWKKSSMSGRKKRKRNDGQGSIQLA